MKQYQDPELQELAERLASDDAGLRRVAVLDLVDCPEPEAVELLIQALNDADPLVRQEAAKVVDEFESAQMADALIAALNDSDEVVRNAAAHALSDLKDPAAAAPLQLTADAVHESPAPRRRRERAVVVAPGGIVRHDLAQLLSLLWDDIWGGI